MSGFEKKLDNEGNINPKYIDLMDEDEAIAGQKFVCLSFISPDKILKKRETYLFDRFVQEFDFTKSMDKFAGFLNYMAYIYHLNVEDVFEKFNSYVKEESSTLKEGGIEDDWKNFLDKNEDKYSEEFNREHSFQTSVRGLKVRGSFNTQEEAENRCKTLQKTDPNHNIFVGPVGIWVPWDPDAYKTGRVEHMEEQLNQLHKEKLESEIKAKQQFEERIKETKRKAIEENIKKAEDSGNKLTQTIDEKGNLTGVMETVDFESRTETTPEEAQKYNQELMERILNEQNQPDDDSKKTD
tara:strand:+ start:292 stop:1179 length:888 start_codon:yes stop_codon:yes gene_type:complete